jgi:hypothetical protein
MSTRRAGALLVLSALIIAVSCGSDDAAPTSSDAGAGEAGAPPASSGKGTGAASNAGGERSSAGEGGAPLGAGGVAAPTAGAEQGGEPMVPGGGAGGEAGTGESGAGGAAGAGGAGPEPPLFADDFDSESLQEGGGLYSTNYVEFSRWDVASGSVDVTVLPNDTLESPGGYGGAGPARGVVVDLNGSTLQDGTLETKAALTFAAGETYTLRYVLGNARNRKNAVTVSIASLVSETRTQNTITPFTVYEATFTPLVAVTAKLVFESAGGGDDDGLLLDEVSIRRGF